MGLVGAGIVGAWAFGLLKGTSRVLLDREINNPVVSEIRKAVESPSSKGETRIAELHVRRVGKSSFACALTVVTHDPRLTALASQASARGAPGNRPRHHQGPAVQIALGSAGSPAGDAGLRFITALKTSARSESRL
jgi:divalent metal cation (Fe/Co/Zn/Cd) transporter